MYHNIAAACQRFHIYRTQTMLSPSLSGSHPDGDAPPSVNPRPPLFPPRYAAAAAGRGRGASGSSLRPRVRDDDRRATTHGRATAAATVATSNESGPLPHPVYHSSPNVVYPNPMQQPQVQPSAGHRRGHGGSPGSGRGHHQSRSPPPTVRQHLVSPFSVLSRPPHQPPIPPDMLILDMRCYTSIEDAIFQVTSYLQNVRQLAMERGLVGREEVGSWSPDGFRTQLFVTIVAGVSCCRRRLRCQRMAVGAIAKRHYLQRAD